MGREVIYITELIGLSLRQMNRPVDFVRSDPEPPQRYFMKFFCAYQAKNGRCQITYTMERCRYIQLCPMDARICADTDSRVQKMGVVGGSQQGWNAQRADPILTDSD